MGPARREEKTRKEPASIEEERLNASEMPMSYRAGSRFLRKILPGP